VTTGREKDKVVRHSVETAYGAAYVRTVLHHHVAAAQPAPAAAGAGAGASSGSSVAGAQKKVKA
jgi:hypothetical protein